MKNFLIDFTIAIFLNLIIFFCIGFGLDYFFKTRYYVIIMLVLSIFSLGLIFYFKYKKFTKELKTLNTQKNEQ